MKTKIIWGKIISSRARALAVLALILILVLGLFAVSTRLTPLSNFLYQLFYQPSALYDQWYIHLLFPIAGLIGLLVYLYIDYRQHLLPLKLELPDVRYTPLHHAKVVIIPRARHTWKDIVYWLSFGTASAILSIAVVTFGMVSFVQAAPGTLTVTIDQKSGTTDPNPSYTSVFTVQFSEPIDKTTFTNPDITLAGTAPGQAVQSITEAGTFDKTTYEVRIQATSAGTITPSIDQELITAQSSPTNTNNASTSTDNSVTYDGTYKPDEFVTTWKTDNPGISNSTSITIPTRGVGNYFSVDWDNDGIFDQNGIEDNITHDFGVAGTYTIRIKGTYPGLELSSAGDQQKALDVKQWGTNQWQLLSLAFESASNLNISAIDAPDLSQVNNLFSMFGGASSFNSNINHWDTSQVTDMSYMFAGATSFNQPLNNWDTSKVTNIDGMFDSASSFNQTINSWDVSNVVTMVRVFGNANSFNQPLDDWNVSNVTNMFLMFDAALSFNQPLNSWNTGQVTNMFGMFIATPFNQPLGNWDVSNVTNMSSMFFGGVGLSTTNYDATLTAWSQQNLESSVVFDAGTSKYCVSETQRQSIITNFNWIINDGGKDCPPPVVSTKSATNITQNSATLNGITSPTGVTERGFEYGIDTNYGQQKVDSSAIEYKLVSEFGLHYTEGGEFGALSQIWGLAIDKQGFVYLGELQGRVLKYDADGVLAGQFFDSGVNGANFNSPPMGIDTDSNDNVYIATGYEVQKFDTNGNFITKWGSQGSGNGQFTYWARNITIDTNDNVYVVDKYQIQKFDSSGNFIKKWGSQGSGNGQINNPLDIALDSENNVYIADFSNQRIQKFDNDGNYLDQWTLTENSKWVASIAVDSADNIIATNNQVIEIFTKDGNLINKLTPDQIQGMHAPTIYSVEVAENDAIYATNQSYNDPQAYILNPVVQVFSLGAITASLDNLICSTTYHYRAYATNSYGTGYGEDKTFTTEACPPPQRPYIMRVKTDAAGVTNPNNFYISFANDNHFDESTNFSIDCDSDGTPEFVYPTDPDTQGANCQYNTPGEYDISIHGSFPGMNYGYEGGCEGVHQNASDVLKILDVKQWGDGQWRSLDSMFYCASNMTMSATDAPDLSLVDNLWNVFNGATSFNSNINHWDVSGISSMDMVFYGATAFNQPLNNWDTSNVTRMMGVFTGATAFNQPLNNWDTSSVTDMWSVFASATAFNQPLNNWDTSNVTYMRGMFLSAASFDQSLASWDVSNVVDMQYMFGNNDALIEQLMIGVPYDDWPQIYKDMYGLPSSGLSTANYDATLTAWSQQNIEGWVTFDAGTSKYCASEADRQSIIDTKFWVINDSGKDCPDTPTATDMSLNISLLNTEPIEQGDTVRYKFTVKNEGPNNAYAGSFYYVILPVDFTFGSIETAGFELDGPPIDVTDLGSPILSSTYPNNKIIIFWTDMSTSSNLLNLHNSFDIVISGIASAGYTNSSNEIIGVLISMNNEPSFMDIFSDAISNNQNPFILPYNNVASHTYTYTPNPNPNPDPTSTTPPTTPTPTPTTPTTPTNPPNPTTPTNPTSPETPTTSSPAPQTPNSPLDQDTTPPNDDLPLLKELDESLSPTDQEHSKTKSSFTMTGRQLLPFSAWILLLALAALYAYASALDKKRYKGLMQASETFKRSLATYVNYMQLAAHFLRNPLAKLQGAVELLKSEGSNPIAIDQNLVSVLGAKTQSLTSQTDKLLSESASLTVNQQTATTNLQLANKAHIIRRPEFWIPAVTASVAAIIMNYQFVWLNARQLFYLNIALQVLLACIALVALAAGLYYREQNKRFLAIAMAQQKIDKEIEDTKQRFINQAYVQLNDDLVSLANLSGQVPDGSAEKSLRAGTTELRYIVDRFDEFATLAKVVPGLHWKTALEPIFAEVLQTQTATAARESKAIAASSGSAVLDIEPGKLKRLLALVLNDSISSSASGDTISVNVHERPKQKGAYIEVEDLGEYVSDTELFSVNARGKNPPTIDKTLDLALAKVLAQQTGGSLTIKNNGSLQGRQLGVEIG